MLTAVDVGTVWICPAILLVALFNASPRADPALAVVAAECACTMADSATACGKAARTPRRTEYTIPNRMRARISGLPEQPSQSLAVAKHSPARPGRQSAVCVIPH